MIAPSKETPLAHAWQRDFLAMLPTIQQHAHFTFRTLPLERREEMVQRVVTNAFVAFVRLAKLGRMDMAFASPLARYAAAQVRAGRQVGMELNANEVLSRYAQRRKGFQVERLDQVDEVDGTWRELVVEDRNAGPADIAATRLDVSAWLSGLSPRNRRLAEALAVGETTKEAARKFSVTPGRISQLRQRLREAWDRFQCNHLAGQPAAMANG